MIKAFSVLLMLLSVNRCSDDCKPALNLEYVTKHDVVAVVRVNEEQPEKDYVHAAVVSVYKGGGLRSLRIKTEGFAPEKKQSYLVYAFHNKDYVTLEKCSRSAPLSKATEDVDFLKRSLPCIDESLIPKTPGACIKLYEPVCGCDGKTYGNSCEARHQGIAMYTVGACK